MTSGTFWPHWLEVVHTNSASDVQQTYLSGAVMGYRHDRDPLERETVCFIRMGWSETHLGHDTDL